MRKFTIRVHFESCDRCNRKEKKGKSCGYLGKTKIVSLLIRVFWKKDTR